MESKKKRMYLMMGLLIFLAFKPQILPNIMPMGHSYIPNSTLMAFLFGSMYYMGELSAEWVKNRSPRILSNNVSDSTSRNGIIEEDGWTFMRLGGILHKTWPPVKGSNGTLITPNPAVTPLNEGIFVDASDEKVEKDQLDPILKQTVEKYDLPKPYYVAKSPTEVEATNQSYVKWQDYKKKENELKNTLDMMQKEIMRDTNKVVKWREDLGEKSNIKGMLQRIKEGKNEGD